MVDAHQPTMLTVGFAASDKKYGNQNARQKQLSESLVSFIVNCSLPLSLVDNPEFRRFLNDMDPKFTPPCRQTVTYSTIPRQLMERKNLLIEFLDKCSDVCLTTDAQTDRRSHAFLGVTVHSFVIGVGCSSHLLAFKSLPGSHTGQKMADELEAVISEFSIENKVRCIVSDNTSNMRRGRHRELSW